jgi:hypothetical protein
MRTSSWAQSTLSSVHVLVSTCIRFLSTPPYSSVPVAEGGHRRHVRSVGRVRRKSRSLRHERLRLRGPPGWPAAPRTTSRYSQSSRLAREAPRPSRCDARLSPRAASHAAMTPASGTSESLPSPGRVRSSQLWLTRSSSSSPGSSSSAAVAITFSGGISRPRLAGHDK